MSYQDKIAYDSAVLELKVLERLLILLEYALKDDEGWESTDHLREMRAELTLEIEMLKKDIIFLTDNA